MHFIGYIIINKIGFETTTYDCCIYRKVIDGEMITFLRMVDDCLLSCKNEKTARNIFNIIGKKMRFDTEKVKGIIPFQVLEVINDYSGFDIGKTFHYIEMSCHGYINDSCKSHG